MSIYASMPGIDDESPCGAPWLYRGSHILPAATDPRGGHVDLAAIPSHITRDGRDDRPEDGAPWPWLRLSVHAADDDPTVVLGPAQARELARQLTGWAARAREDSHTPATDATEATDGPEPTDEPNGPQAGADGRDTYRAAFQHLLPESAWHLAGHLADAAAGLADQWTRALEQRNSRLRGELRQARAEVGQLRADVDHRDQIIRHLENGLKHERATVQRVRALHVPIPGTSAGTICDGCSTGDPFETHNWPCPTIQALEEQPATTGEVLPHNLLRLIDMHKYVSTACDTAGACETAAADHVDDADRLTERAAHLHARCRRTHKFTGAPCACDCHHQSRR